MEQATALDSWYHDRGEERDITFRMEKNGIWVYKKDGGHLAASGDIWSKNSKLAFFIDESGMRPASQYFCVEVSAELDGTRVEV